MQADAISWKRYQAFSGDATEDARAATPQPQQFERQAALAGGRASLSVAHRQSVTDGVAQRQGRLAASATATQEPLALSLR